MATDISQSSEAAIIEADTTQDSVTLHKDRTYTIVHTGLNASGGADANTIWFAQGDVTASWAVGTDKLPVQDGQSVVVGPALATLNFKTAAGSPVFSIIPGVYERGAGYGTREP